MIKNNALILVLVLVALAVAGYLFFGRGDNPLENMGGSVATVNGVAISKADYDAQLASAIEANRSQGVDVTIDTIVTQIEAQVLEDLIANELINQEIVKANIKPTDEEIEAQFQALLVQTGGAEALQAELDRTNITESQLRENISKQLAVQAYLIQNIDTSSISVTEAEISQFYADYSKAQADAGQTTVPEQKDLSDQIRQQITLNKQQALVVELIAKLRASSEVEVAM